MLKELILKIPLLEALEKISGYAKFMTELVTMKRVVIFEDVVVYTTVVQLLLDI